MVTMPATIRHEGELPEDEWRLFRVASFLLGGRQTSVELGGFKLAMYEMLYIRTTIQCVPDKSSLERTPN